VLYTFLSISRLETTARGGKRSHEGPEPRLSRTSKIFYSSWLEFVRSRGSVWGDSSLLSEDDSCGGGAGGGRGGAGLYLLSCGGLGEEYELIKRCMRVP